MSGCYEMQSAAWGHKTLMLSRRATKCILCKKLNASGYLRWHISIHMFLACIWTVCQILDFFRYLIFLTSWAMSNGSFEPWWRAATSPCWAWDWRPGSDGQVSSQECVWWCSAVIAATLCNPAGWNEAEVALLQLQMVLDPERVLQAFGACVLTSSSQGRRFFVSKCFGQFYCGSFSKCF